MGATKPHPFTESEISKAIRSRATAHPVRIKILSIIRDQPCSLNDLAFLLQMSVPAVREHLDKLRDAEYLADLYFQHGNTICINQRKKHYVERILDEG